MTEENTMANTKDTTAPAPNGHRDLNGAASGEPRATGPATETVAKDAQPSSNKNRKKRRSQRNKGASVETAAATTTDQPAPSETIAPKPPQPPIEKIAAALIAKMAAAPIDKPPAAPIEPAAAPIDESVESLRLRMKVWTDRTTSKRYLMPRAFMRDVVNGQPISDVMYAYAMHDDDTKIVTLTASEWNALPFFYFQEDGPAPRATTRPTDMVVSYARTT